MNLTEQKLNEILKQIIDSYSPKGAITTNALCDIMEKYETTPNQMDYVYKSIAEAGIQIIDEAERDRELQRELQEEQWRREDEENSRIRQEQARLEREELKRQRHERWEEDARRERERRERDNQRRAEARAQREANQKAYKASWDMRHLCHRCANYCNGCQGGIVGCGNFRPKR